jgi:hypothetical protein
MTGKWTGEYTYGKGYPEEDQGTSVVFNLVMNYEEGDITGSCTDDESLKIFDKPATIQGFIDNDFISFIKKYPSLWTIDEKGNAQIFEDIPPIEIHYYGHFADNKFSGEWDMSFEIEDEHGDSHFASCAGTWSMYKE